MLRLFYALLAASLLLLSISCEKRSQADDNKLESIGDQVDGKEKSAQERRQERVNKESNKIDDLIRSNSALAELISKHRAVPDWEKEVRDRGRVFAFDVQEAIVRQDKRPILLVTEIDDAVKDGDKYYLNLEAINYTADIYFTLECSAEQVQQIAGQVESVKDNYAIIADVASVRKIRFSVEASPQSEDEAEIELNASDAFNARGRF